MLGIGQPIDERFGLTSVSTVTPSQHACGQGFRPKRRRIKLQHRDVGFCVPEFGMHATEQFPFHVGLNFGRTVAPQTEPFAEHRGSTTQDHHRIRTEMMAQVTLHQHVPFKTVHMGEKKREVDWMSAKARTECTS